MASDEAEDPKELSKEQMIIHRIISQDGKFQIDYPDEGSEVHFTSPAEPPKEINCFYSMRFDEMENKGGTMHPEKTRNFVGRIFVEQDWPAMRVKPDFPDIQICWNRNRGFLVHKKVTGLIGTLPQKDCPSLDRHSTLAAKSFYLDKNEGLEHENVGNDPLNIEWTSSLPHSTTVVTLPFSWYRGPPYAYFPNHEIKKSIDFRINPQKKREIWRLIMMRRRVGKSWEYLLPTKDLLMKYLDGVPTGGLLPETRMISEAMDLLANERLRLTACKTRDIWAFEDFITMKYKNLIGYSETAEFEIKTKRIIKAIFILVENVTAKKRYRNLGNYTSNAEDLTAGYDVVESVSFYRDSTPVNYSVSFIKGLMREFFPSTPTVRGVLGVPLCQRSRDLEENVGIAIGVQSNNKVNVKLRYGGPRGLTDDDPNFPEYNKNEKFRPYLVLQVVKHMSLTKEGDNGFVPKFVE